MLKKMGILRPYGLADIIAAERDDVIRENESAARQHSSSSNKVKVVAIVASAALRRMQDR